MSGPRKCDWNETEDGQWETACEHVFEFLCGGVELNGFKFCPWCGGTIVPIAQPWEEPEDEG